MTAQIKIPFQPAILAEICLKYHIRKLALFGSVLRDDFHPESDVDILLEFEQGHTPDFFRLYDIEQEFSELFGGRAIDLVTFRGLNRHLRKSVLETAVTLYEQR